MVISSVKLFNVFGIVTVWPGQAVALAVSVMPSHKSIEKTVSKELDIPGLEGTHQILFGAKIDPRGGKPEIAVFQLEEKSGGIDLASNPEIQDLLNEVVNRVKISLLS